MAITYVGTGTIVDVTSGNIAIDEPASCAAGDLLIAHLGWRGTPNFTLPAGWTLIDQQLTANNTAGTSTSKSSALLAYKFRGGTAETGVTFSRTGGAVCTAVMVALRGVSQTTPIDQFASGSQAGTGTSSGLTTTKNNTYIFVAHCLGRSGASSAETATNPSTGWVERYDHSNSSSTFCNITGVTAPQPSGGATGNFTASFNSSTWNTWIACNFIPDSNLGAKWEYVGSAAATNVASGDVTISEPTLCSAGDLMVVAIAYRDSVTFSPPSGWTQIFAENSGNVLTTTSAVASLAVFYKIRTGSAETGIVFSRTGGDLGSAQMLVYRGNDQTSPLDVSVSLTTGSATTSPSTGTGLSPAMDNELLLLFGANPTSTASWASAEAATNPSVMNERIDVATTTGADGGLMISDAAQGTKSATGAFSFTSSISRFICIGAVAFKPVTPVFDPTQISNCISWYDASGPGSVSQTSGAVSAWGDGSSTGLTLTQGSSGAQPTYSLTSFPGGLPGITFDGSSQWLESLGGVPVTSITDFTAFVVCKSSITTASNGTMFCVGFGDFNNQYVHGSGANSGQNYFGCASATSNSTVQSAFSSLSDSSAHILMVTRDTSGNVTFKHDATAESTPASNTQAPTTMTFSIQQTTIGAFVFAPGAAGSYFGGVIGEIVLYDRALNSTEIGQMETYLEAKWGLTPSNSIVATMAGTATLTAGLTTAIRMASDMADTATLTPTLTTGKPLSLGLTDVATMTAALTAPQGFTVAMADSSTMSASMTTAIRMATSMSDVASFTASLTAGSLLASAMIDVVTLTAGLTTAIRMAAGMADVATLTPTLTTAKPLASGMSGVSSMTAALTTFTGLSMAMSSAATMQGTLIDSIMLMSNMVCSVTFTGNLTVPAAFKANFRSSSQMAGQLGAFALFIDDDQPAIVRAEKRTVTLRAENRNVVVPNRK